MLIRRKSQNRIGVYRGAEFFRKKRDQNVKNFRKEFEKEFVLF